nr:unnamed protein product [Spirometra erinaceieuropaei]
MNVISVNFGVLLYLNVVQPAASVLLVDGNGEVRQQMSSDDVGAETTEKDWRATRVPGAEPCDVCRYPSSVLVFGMSQSKRGGRKPASVAAQSAHLENLTLETPEKSEPKDLIEDAVADSVPNTNNKSKKKRNRKKGKSLPATKPVEGNQQPDADLQPSEAVDGEKLERAIRDVIEQFLTEFSDTSRPDVVGSHMPKCSCPGYRLQLRGFVNQKNNCYLISCLRVLFSIKTFVGILDRVSQCAHTVLQHQGCLRARWTPSLAPSVQLLRLMVLLLDEIAPFRSKAPAVGDCLPRDFGLVASGQSIKLDPDLANVLCFEEDFQQDASDCMSRILTQLHEEMIALRRKYSPPEPVVIPPEFPEAEEEEDDEGWTTVGAGGKKFTEARQVHADSGDSSPISLLFGGLLLSRSSYKKESRTADKSSINLKERFFVLPLEINDNKAMHADTVYGGDRGLAWAESERALQKCLWVRRDLSIITKNRVYHASVRSVLLYGYECWALRLEDELKLEVRRVEDSFTLLSRGETLSDFRDPDKGDCVVMSRRVCLDHLPPVLLLQLNRFYYASSSNASGQAEFGIQKIPKAIPIYKNLQITEDVVTKERAFSRRQGAYTLHAIVFHVGYKATRGHYTASVMQAQPQGQSETAQPLPAFYYLDDERVFSLPAERLNFLLSTHRPFNLNTGRFEDILPESGVNGVPPSIAEQPRTPYLLVYTTKYTE